MRKPLYLLALFGLVCIANCSKTDGETAPKLKTGTIIDANQYDGGPIASSSSWDMTPKERAAFERGGKQVGLRYIDAVSGAQLFSFGKGWRHITDEKDQVPANQRGSILLVIGQTVKAARDLDEMEMKGGNPLTRNGFSDRSNYEGLIKDYRNGITAIHDSTGVNQASSSEIINSTIPSLFDNDSELYAKSRKRHRLLNAAASTVGRENPFVVQSFMTKIEAEAKIQSETSPLRSQIKAPTAK